MRKLWVAECAAGHVAFTWKSVMELRYEDDFLDGAVFVCTNACAARQGLCPPALQIQRFHRAREKCYQVLDPDERNAAFSRLHLEWFREWGLDNLLLGLVNEFPLLPGTLNTLVFRKARAKSDEGAELYVNNEAKISGIVALQVERFQKADQLKRFLRHEFTHLHDMLNPEFRYSPQLHLASRNVAQQRLTRERYRLLWDITIDGRLERTNESPATRHGHRDALDRAFGFWPEAKREEVFKSLWENAQPRHNELLAHACDPRHAQSGCNCGPGAPCPLCGFTTFSWAKGEHLCEQTVRAICRDFPDWNPAHGACRRCADIYRRGVTQLLAI